MKVSFPNCGSGAGISIRAAINALLNWHKAERTQTAARKKNVPQITPGWDYRPREPVRRHAAAAAAPAETPETLTSTPAAVEAGNMIWFDLINPDRAIEGAKTKAPLWGRAFTVSGYDQGPIDHPTAIAE
jgi:hypothetical protein